MSTTASQQKAYVKLEIVIAARFSAGFDASMAVGQMQMEAAEQAMFALRTLLAKQEKDGGLRFEIVDRGSAEIKIGQPDRNDAGGDIF